MPAVLNSSAVTTARRLHHSYEDYLAALEMSEVKLEYCDGEIYAMAGGTPAHADLAAAAIRLLSNALLERCRVSTSDLKVRIEATGLSTFPDVSVVCGEREFARLDRNAITNPTLLIEVTSKSTEDYDRGEKLEHYKRIPSLEAVVIVSHREPRMEVWSRASNSEHWIKREASAGESAVIPALGCALSVDTTWQAAAEPT